MRKNDELQIGIKLVPTLSVDVVRWTYPNGEGEPAVRDGEGEAGSIDEAVSVSGNSAWIDEDLDALYAEAEALGCREFRIHAYDGGKLWQVLGFLPHWSSGMSQSARGRTAAEALRNAIEQQKASQRYGTLWAISGSLSAAFRAMRKLDTDDPFRVEFGADLGELASLTERLAQKAGQRSEGD